MCKIRELASFIGSLGFCCQASIYGWVYLKNFERDKVKALEKCHGDYEAFMEISSKLNSDFEWWTNNICTIVKPIRNLRFSLEIFSDSSLTGWGAYCKREAVHGFWSRDERKFHINYLEILTAFFALKSFAKNIINWNILLRIDNTTALAYINQMGGVRSKTLSELSKKMWIWCARRNIWLFASYIRSKDNVNADFESRRLEPETEYELSERAFRKIEKLYGKPDIDLFASRVNKKCNAYVSWKKDPGSIAIDAFTIDWSHYFFYAFPPFSMIMKVLMKINQEGSRGIVVVPDWPSQTWYPMFMDMIESEPVRFIPNATLLLSSNRERHPLWSQLSLITGILSKRHLQEEE